MTDDVYASELAYLRSSLRRVIQERNVTYTELQAVKAERNALLEELDAANARVERAGFRAQQLLGLEQHMEAVATQIERAGPEILRAWLEHTGYTPDEAERLLSEPEHDAQCANEGGSWVCEDAEGNYLHPDHLAAGDAAELIFFTLSFPTTSSWTEDDEGVTNNSPLYLYLVQEVAKLIRNDAHNLLNGGAHLTARLVLSQLANVHGMVPVPAMRKEPSA